MFTICHTHAHAHVMPDVLISIIVNILLSYQFFSLIFVTLSVLTFVACALLGPPYVSIYMCSLTCELSGVFLMHLEVNNNNLCHLNSEAIYSFCVAV